MINFYKFLEHIDKNEIRHIAYNIAENLEQAQSFADYAQDYSLLHDEDAYKVLFNILFEEEYHRQHAYVIIKKPVKLRGGDIEDRSYITHHLVANKDNWALYLNDWGVIINEDDDYNKLTDDEILKFIKEHFTPATSLQKLTKNSFAEVVAGEIESSKILNEPIRRLIDNFKNRTFLDNLNEYMNYLQYLATLNLDRLFIDYLDRKIKSGDKHKLYVQDFIEELLINHELVGDL